MSSLKFGASIPLQLFGYSLIPSERDLADINNDGRLTRDGFAVAMHLIQGKLSGKEIPAALPQTLVPPSMRSNGPASPFAAVPPHQATEAIRDLLWDDSPPTSTVNTQPQHNVFQPQATGIAPPTISPPSSSRPPQAPEDPFTSATRNCTLLSFHFPASDAFSRFGVQLQRFTRIFSGMMTKHTRHRHYMTDLRRLETSRTRSPPRIGHCRTPRPSEKPWKPPSLTKPLSSPLWRYNLLLRKLPLGRRRVC